MTIIFNSFLLWSFLVIIFAELELAQGNGTILANENLNREDLSSEIVSYDSFKTKEVLVEPRYTGDGKRLTPEQIASFRLYASAASKKSLVINCGGGYYPSLTCQGCGCYSCGCDSCSCGSCYRGKTQDNYFALAESELEELEKLPETIPVPTAIAESIGLQYYYGCFNCPAGYYCPDGTTYYACPPGYSCPSSYMVNPSACSAGYYSSGYYATTCSACGAGAGSSSGSSSCYTCGTGTYSYGGSPCYTTPGGYYANAASGATAIYGCPQGYYSTGGAVGGCSYIQAGYYSNGVSGYASVVYLCPQGSYSSGGAMYCTTIPAGGYSNGVTSGATTYYWCPAGYYSTGSAVSCSVVPAGNYGSASSGATTYYNCGTGYYSPAGSTSCTCCPSGTYNSGTATGSCSSVPAGYYSNAGTCATVVYGCTSGTYSQGGAVGSCSLIPAGYYSNGVSSYATTVYACSAGTYSTGGALYCTSCNAGTAYGSSGGNSASVCGACSSGYYAPNAGSSSCTVVPAGYYGNSGSGATGVTLCAAGSYSLGGVTSCTLCGAGTAYGSSGGSAASVCTACTSGYYSPSAGASACTYVPAGYYSNAASGASYVTLCAAGSYSLGGVTSCTLCSAGTAYGSTGGSSASVCASCTTGYYSPSAGASSCTYVPAGSYGNTATGATTITACAAGSYSTGGVTSCTLCGAGTYYGSTGGSAASVCTNCASGYYAGSAGTSACTQVPAGSYGNSASGATYITTCAAGSYSLAGAITCTPCAAGKYYGSTGGTSSGVCTACAAGFYSSSAGASTCTAVPAGSYANAATGATGFTACDPGYYSFGTVTQCTPVPAGYYANALSGATNYIICVAGSYSIGTVTACTPCNAGYYSSNAGATSSAACTQCAIGYYAPNSGTATCASCAPLTSLLGATYCINWPTSQPSSQPSSRPSTHPTRQPSTQPSGQPSVQPSSQPSRQPSSQPTRQPSNRPSSHPTSQPSEQPSNRPTQQPSVQPTEQPTVQPSGQPTGQPTRQPSRVPSGQPSVQPSGQPTGQPSMQPSAQPSRQPSSVPSVQPSVQPSRQPTVQPTRQPSAQPTIIPTGQPSVQPTGSPSRQPTCQPSRQPSSQPSEQPSAQPSGQPSSQPSGQPTVQPTSSPSRQPSSQPSTQPTAQPSCQPSEQPSSRPTEQPSNQPTSQPSGQPTVSPSRQPSGQPTEQPSSQPSEQPSSSPSRQPSSVPTEQPSGQPTDQPSGQPSEQPSSQPTTQPSRQPSGQPSGQPSVQPSGQPSGQPTRQPSAVPSGQPSVQPTRQPTGRPSCQPSVQPTRQPSAVPSTQPSVQPSNQPSSRPSAQPSSQPSRQPSSQPSTQPSGQPSTHPTRYPSSQPTVQPSTQPTGQPSVSPSRQPSSQPSEQPSRRPSSQPSVQPSAQPSEQPSEQPSSQPTRRPTSQPSSQPSGQPTVQPSAQPSSRPSSQPSVQPSRQPTCAPSHQPTTQPSGQPTDQPSSQPSEQPSAQPTSQPSGQPSAQPSSQPSRQPTARPSSQPSEQPSSRPTSQPSCQPSQQPSDQPTVQPTGRPSRQPSSQPTAQPSEQPSRRPTTQPSGQPTGQPSVQPTEQPSGQPSSQPSSQPTGQPTEQPSGQPSSRPSEQPSAQPSSQPSGQPSSRPSGQPSVQPSAQPSGQPTSRPSEQPSTQPTSQPSRQPSVQPSDQPSRQPTVQPSCQPSLQPTAQPSGQPSVRPSCQPSGVPSSQPSRRPTRQPSTQPSGQPSSRPSAQPSAQPSEQPSGRPSGQPTVQPSGQPSSRPTEQPSSQPSGQPSGQPSTQPTRQPTSQPTVQPSGQPSAQPSVQPSSQPSVRPSCQPSGRPSSQPSAQPSSRPSRQPTVQPSSQPTTVPSEQPSARPTKQPSGVPTSQPSEQPTEQPSAQPSGQPSGQPTDQPSAQPSGQPSVRPSGQPSRQPSSRPSNQPSVQPSVSPTGIPSSQPSGRPSRIPTSQPSALPTDEPSGQPSGIPTGGPTSQPSGIPSEQPSSVPSRSPSTQPSGRPSSLPSSDPSSVPSVQPSSIPSGSPTNQPSVVPSSEPSGLPSSHPSSQPSRIPSGQPSVRPSSHPSRQPSGVPSVQPQAVPTSRPSSQPSRSPTGQPTLFPTVQPTSKPTYLDETRAPTVSPTSSVPTSQPSAGPSGLPTAQPSGLPSSHPSSQPLSYPTSRPSSLPTGRPSADPSGMPSTSPSKQPQSVPSGQPSSLPSGNPSRQPACAPSGVPSAQPLSSPSAQPVSVPSGVPSRQPVSRPSSRPTAQPTSRPSRRPSSQPSRQPSRQPSARPSKQPVARPTSRPSRQPSSQPSRQPTGQPTAHPTAQPVSRPSSKPSSTPSSHPTLQPFSRPTSRPSGQPSRQPTSQPSCQPTRQPTAQPTSVPSTSVPTSSAPLIANTLRTRKPTPRPTMQPSSCPSSSPTSSPTISVDSLWRLKMQSVLQSLAAKDAARAIVSRVNYYDLKLSEESVYGSCEGWQSFQQGELVSNSVLLRLQSIQYVVIDNEFDSIRDSVNSTVTCSHFLNASAILTAVDTQTSVSQWCSGNTWKVSTCAATGMTALCVNCPDPCAQTAQCASSSSSSAAITAVALSPCESSAASSCPSGSRVNVGKVLSVAFKELTPAPDIVQLAVTPARASVRVDALLTGDGFLYCGVYQSSLAKVVTSQSLIVLQNNGGSVVNNRTSILINGLLPLQSYDLYCMSYSEMGSGLSLDKVVASRTSFSTLCCKEVKVSLTAPSFKANQITLNMLQLKLDGGPTEEVTVALSASQVGVNDSVVLYDMFYPSSFTLFNSTFVVGQVQTASLLPLPVGQYDILVTVFGFSASEFSVSFAKSDTIDIIEVSEPPPVPKLLSAVFSSQGTDVTLTFDAPTDKAGLSNIFTCDGLFSFTEAEETRCQWTDSSTVLAFVSGDTAVSVNDVITLQPDRIRAQCGPHDSHCGSWNTTLEASVSIQAPAVAIVPTASLAAPSTIGSCDSLTLDISGSVGSGGRSWESIRFSVSTSTGASTSQIESFLVNSYSPFPPTAIPQQMLSKGVFYIFRLTLCNFLGQCGQTSARVVVLNSAVPSVSLPGLSLRSIASSTALSLSSSSFVSLCDGNVSSAGLAYSWTVSRSGLIDLSISSASKDPSKFLLPAHSLETDSVYQITLTSTVLSTLKSSSQSIQLVVAPSSVVAVILGGSERTLRPSDSLILDGSASYDQDSVSSVRGAAAGLLFDWTCYQTSPTLSDVCGVTVGEDANSETFSVSAAVDGSSANTTSLITLTIYDSTGLRTSQASVSVQVLSSDWVPSVSLFSNVVGKLNPSDKLILSGEIDLPPQSSDNTTTAVSALAVWSVDDSSIDLSQVGLLSAQFNVSRSGLFYLPIQFNALPAGSSFVFSLACTLLSSSQGDHSSSSVTGSITILTNAPPLPGVFSVSPAVGVEASDEFSLVASQWEDEDLPLSYLFTVTPVSLPLPLQSRSEVPFGFHFLPAGLLSLNYSLHSTVTVFDVYSANTSSSAPVTVTPLHREDPTVLHSVLLARLSVSNVSADSIKSAASLVSAVLNAVDCSLAPNCSALNRHSCSSVVNTCGQCLSDSLFGDPREANSVCITSAQYTDVVLASSSVPVNCTSDVNCSSVSWQHCSPLSGYCERTQQQCPNDCSGHGSCLFLSSTNVSQVLSTCETGSSGCLAQCLCDEGYDGVSCSISAQDSAMRAALREQVTQSLTSLLALEDATPAAVSGWSNSIASLTQGFVELTISSVSTIHGLISTVLTSATSLVVSQDSVGSVLDSLNSIASFQLVTYSYTSSSGRRLSEAAHQIRSLEDNLQQFGALTSANMLSGQDSVHSVRSQFRMSSFALSADSSSSSSYGSMSLPLTTQEIAEGLQPQSVSLTSPSDDSKVTTVSIAASLYGNPEFQSNPLHVHFNSKPSSTASSGSAVLYVDVVLQNNAVQDFSDRSPAPFEDLCHFDDYKVHTHVCVDSGVVISAACNGTREILSNRCPYTQPVGVCNSVRGVHAVDGGCSVLTYDGWSTTCRCPITSAVAAAQRRLQQSVGDDDFNSTSAVEGTTGGSSSIVSMVSFIGHDIESTILSAQSLSVSSVRSSWKVLTTLGGLAFAVLFLGLLAHRSDSRMRQLKVAVDEVKNKKQEMLGVGARRLPTAVKGNTGLVAPEGTKLEKTRSSRTSDAKRFQLLRLGSMSGSIKSNEMKLSKEMLTIEASLPNMLRSTPFSQRFTEEVKHFHRWLGVIFYYSPNFPRVLRVISLATNVIAMLFVQSITYNLTNPDDGTCDTYTRKSECLAELSPFGTGDTKCLWHHGYRKGHCTFNEPSNSLKVVLFVAVFAALISTPIALTADWVIMNILSARTEKRKVHHTTAPVAGALHAVVPEAHEEHHNTMRYSVVGRRSALVNSSNRPTQVNSTAVVPITGSAADRTVARRRFSMAQYLGLQTSNALTNTLQDDLTQLLRGLCGYRATLSEAQKVEFNNLWGLAESGHFITNNNTNDRSWRARLWLSRASGGDSAVQEAITNDLKDVRARLEGELESFNRHVRSDVSRGQRLLFLFQRDLMPGVNGKILESKGNRDDLKAHEVSAAYKLFGWLFIVGLNMAMLFYIYLFAVQQTEIRQSAWFKSFMIWLFMEIVFVATAVVYVTHFLIPSLTMKDVAKIKQKLLDTIKDYNDQQKQMRLNKARGLGAIEEGEDEDEQEKPPAVFNAASFLFVSYRLAQQYPDLRESKIIARFSTPWPTQSYHHVRDVSKSYSKKFSAVTRSISMILIFLVGSLMQVPHSLQDMIISTCTTGMMGYTFLVHIQLYSIYPVLVIVPALILGALTHFVIKAASASAKQKLAKLSPLKPVEKGAGKKLFPGDVGYVPRKFGSDAARVSPLHEQEETEGAVTAVGNAQHKTRRASIQEGRAVLRDLRHDLHKPINRDDIFHSDSEEEEQEEKDCTDDNEVTAFAADAAAVGADRHFIDDVVLSEDGESHSDNSDSDEDHNDLTLLDHHSDDSEDELQLLNSLMATHKDAKASSDYMGSVVRHVANSITSNSNAGGSRRGSNGSSASSVVGTAHNNNNNNNNYGAVNLQSIRESVVDVVDFNTNSDDEEKDAELAAERHLRERVKINQQAGNIGNNDTVVVTTAFATTAGAHETIMRKASLESFVKGVDLDTDDEDEN